MTQLLHKLFATIHKNPWRTFTIFALLSFIVSYYGLSQHDDYKEGVIWLPSLALSFADLPDDTSFSLVIAKLFWMITFASAAFSLFLRDWSYKQLFKSIQGKKHTAIIGIGELSHNYILELDNSKTIILNNNKNLSTDMYKNKGYCLKELDIEDIIQDLNLKMIERAVINVGTDRDNINLAFKIINQYLSSSLSSKLRLIVRIENRELNSVFSSNQVFSSTSFKNSKLELKTYSFFEECAMSIFQENFIDGESNDIINSKEEYYLAIVGDGNLANKIVYEASKIAHLPNENKLNIYLVSNDPEKIKKSLIKSYPGIEKISTIQLHEKSLDYNTLEFYKDDIWHSKNLKNVIICYDDENINLEICSSMQDKTFIKDNDLETKVLFGVFNQVDIANRLDEDNDRFNMFKSFGNSSNILTKENIFDDKNHTIAKLINYTYDGLLKDGKYDKNALFNYTQNIEKIDNTWFKTNHFDKQSSIAQAKHIKMKLKVLGLFLIKNDKKTSKELLEINRKMIDSKFDLEFNGGYTFPNNFEDQFFDKMIRLEHNRWNAYHYLNGWEYSKNKNKPTKEHDCLLPIEQFPEYFTDKKRLTNLIEWDIYAFMYIPNYLAELNYKLIDKK